MGDIRGKLYTVYSLEQLSSGDSALHALHPLSKLLGTFVYILCVASFDRYALFRLVPYIFYPVLLMALGDIPYGMIWRRAALALPFCLLAGLSNLFFERGVAADIGGFSVTLGAVSMLAILFRTLLCVSAVLILVALTPFGALMGQLRRVAPDMLVSVLEMVYRYLGALGEEAASMYAAYALRSPERGLQMRHMGSFLGQLLIRSFDRAERIYAAMKCRGYPMWARRAARRPLRGADYAYMGLVCGFSLLFRAFDLPLLLSRALEGWL